MRPSKTVTISLPPDLAKRAAKTARSEGRSRSELFREALRQYLARQERWDQIFALGADAARKTRATEADVLRAVDERRRSRRPA